MNIANNLYFPKWTLYGGKIKKYGRVLELAVDGQSDSPGHSATYNTVSANDAETNKVINFRVVYVKVWNCFSYGKLLCLSLT